MQSIWVCIVSIAHKLCFVETRVADGFCSVYLVFVDDVFVLAWHFHGREHDVEIVVQVVCRDVIAECLEALDLPDEDHGY